MDFYLFSVFEHEMNAVNLTSHSLSVLFRSLRNM